VLIRLFGAVSSKPNDQKYRSSPILLLVWGFGQDEIANAPPKADSVLSSWLESSFGWLMQAILTRSCDKKRRGQSCFVNHPPSNTASNCRARLTAFGLRRWPWTENYSPNLYCSSQPLTKPLVAEFTGRLQDASNSPIAQFPSDWREIDKVARLGWSTR